MKYSVKKRSARLGVALCAAVGIAVSSAPAAHAGGAGIFGAVRGTAVQSSQLNRQIKYYNDTEEGRTALLEELKKEYGVSENHNLQYRLETIMSNLTQGIGAVDASIYEKPYNYFVNKEQSFNAFCSLGHNLSVNEGLFSVIENEDEIAVVLAHEMGHGQSDHPAKGAKKSIGPRVLAAAAGGNIAAVVVANAIQNQGFTKPMEWEADNLAFTYITHTNYNPGSSVAIWQRIMERSSGGSNSLLTLMAGGSDHPSEKSRRDNYGKKLQEYSGGHVSAKDGVVSVNGQALLKPAALSSMSEAERSYFVLGNLAAAYHNGHAASPAHVSGSTVYLGAQAIISCTSDDDAPQAIADRLNAIK